MHSGLEQALRGFGMSVGFIALFTNDFVNGHLVIDLVDITVFIGIGMGIGSLKDFIDRAS